jgi:hypothetical protein
MQLRAPLMRAAGGLMLIGSAGCGVWLALQNSDIVVRARVGRTEWTAAYGGDAPIEDVEAGDLRAGDVVRVDDPQAHRVERVVCVGARVVLEMRPVGLEISEAVRVTLPVDRLVTRLGMAAD